MLLALIPAAFFAYGQTLVSDPTVPPRRVKVPADVASQLLAQKTSVRYPDSARNAGIQGTVLLNIVIGYAGEVKELTTSSGDHTLAQAAMDAVKLWKYKPYILDGVPAEMETQVTVTFHIKDPLPAMPPPVGTFKDSAYSNEHFDLFYPLSRDWIRETELMRKKFTDEGQAPGMYVLIAAVHIPEHTAPLEADSSFVLSALERSVGAAETCDQHLENLAKELHSRKEAQQKGNLSAFSIAGHDFHRADFEFRNNPSHRAFICTEERDFVLQWNIVGLSKSAVEGAVSTLKSITGSPPASRVEPSQGQQSPDRPASVQISSGVSQGFVLKKVQPIYPEPARRPRIQGSVRMSAVINKRGDVIDLEVIEGPIELVVSAVNAVRQWKYKPYLFRGEAVDVNTVITVNYQLSGV